MELDRWNAFRERLRATDGGRYGWLLNEFPLFGEFVDQTPEVERIPALLYAYDRYRQLNQGSEDDATVRFESSCYSILISTILSRDIRPDCRQATEILRRSFHRCGHGGDVAPPLELAERAFHNRRYSTQLFNAVATYRETLRGTTSTIANNVKRRLNWVLWHDPRRIEKKCCTRQIQLDIHAMPPKKSFAWQWLLRNHGLATGSLPVGLGSRRP